jgi:hypothetical protein
MPAQAGIHLEIVELFQQRWTPAFAGVTTEEQGGDDERARKNDFFSGLLNSD